MPDVFASIVSLNQKISAVVNNPQSPTTVDVDKTKSELLDELIEIALFSVDQQLRDLASNTIYLFAEMSGVYPSSIHPLYQDFAKQKAKGFTVPAINIRMLTFDIARHIFKLIKKHHIGAVVFEISRSEMEYTKQSPKEYAVSVLAAAMKEEYQGPVFLQGDHFQINPLAFTSDPDKELEAIKSLILSSFEAKFYNIDIDASTLVNLKAESLINQQILNSYTTNELAKFIRSHSPIETPISIGGEIGHIGDRNSKAEDFHAFMALFEKNAVTPGLSKISIQTGTTHGGIPREDGSLKQPNIDFSLLREISHIAQTQYHMGGAVQHGASTLPVSLFDKFVENQTLEIHLSTGIQNIVFATMPKELKSEMYQWIDNNLSHQRQQGQSDEQFYYKTRKISLGHFKKELWDLSHEEKEHITSAVANHLEEIFLKLNLANSRDIVEQSIP
ncbi:MAG: class II fructose-bisphosphate aldolase [Candidatus Levybacteria bacterium]|nr:class II fructose-bisphosphate aldolase [Candidatus Levybacteria bacterium]